MSTHTVRTHIRAVANVCLSVCLALRRTVLNSVKEHMELCYTVCLSYQCCEGQCTQTLRDSFCVCAVECVCVCV